MILAVSRSIPTQNQSNFRTTKPDVKLHPGSTAVNHFTQPRPVDGHIPHSRQRLDRSDRCNSSMYFIRVQDGKTTEVEASLAHKFENIDNVLHLRVQIIDLKPALSTAGRKTGGTMMVKSSALYARTLIVTSTHANQSGRMVAYMSASAK